MGNNLVTRRPGNLMRTQNMVKAGFLANLKNVVPFLQSVSALRAVSITVPW